MHFPSTSSWYNAVSNKITFAKAWNAKSLTDKERSKRWKDSNQKGLLILSVKYFFVKFNTDCDIHMHFDTKECQNRLVLKRLNERISEYIWMEFSTQTNVWICLYEEKILQWNIQIKVWTKIIRVIDYHNIFVTLWFNINVTQVQSIHGIVSHILTKGGCQIIKMEN